MGVDGQWEDFWGCPDQRMNAHEFHTSLVQNKPEKNVTKVSNDMIVGWASIDKPCHNGQRNISTTAMTSWGWCLEGDIGPMSDGVLFKMGSAEKNYENGKSICCGQCIRNFRACRNPPCDKNFKKFPEDRLHLTEMFHLLFFQSLLSCCIFPSPMVLNKSAAGKVFGPWWVHLVSVCSMKESSWEKTTVFSQLVNHEVAFHFF